MENKHWNKPYSKRLYDLIQRNIDKVNHTNHLYEKQERLKMTKYKYKLGTAVIAQSDDNKHTAMGEVTGYYDHPDNGKTYYLICNSFWLPHQIKLQ